MRRSSDRFFKIYCAGQRRGRVSRVGMRVYGKVRKHTWPSNKMRQEQDRGILLSGAKRADSPWAQFQDHSRSGYISRSFRQMKRRERSGAPPVAGLLMNWDWAQANGARTLFSAELIAGAQRQSH